MKVNKIQEDNKEPFYMHDKTYYNLMSDEERNTPKKYKDAGLSSVYFCPSCLHAVRKFEDCEVCGQKIDWGDKV